MKPLTKEQAAEIKAFLLGTLSQYCKYDTWIRQQRRKAIRDWLRERTEETPRKKAPTP